MKKITLIKSLTSATIVVSLALPIISCSKTQDTERKFILTETYQKSIDAIVETVPKGMVMTLTSKDVLKYVSGIKQIIIGKTLLSNDEYIFDVETSKLFITNEILNKYQGDIVVWPEPLKWIPGIVRELDVSVQFDLEPMVSDVMKADNLVVKPIYTDDTIGKPLEWNKDYVISDEAGEIENFDTTGYEFKKSGINKFNIKFVAKPEITYDLEIDVRLIPEPTLNYLTFKQLDDQNCSVSINKAATIDQNTEISIPKIATILGKQYNVTSIEKNGFNSIKFKSIYIANTIKTIDENAFAYSDAKEIRFEKQSNSTYIGNNAFANIKNVNAMIIPANCIYIENSAFTYSELKKISFEDNSKLQSIGASAFSNSHLETIILPNSIEKIGFGAFSTKYYSDKCRLTFGDESKKWLACSYGHKDEWTIKKPKENAYELMSYESSLSNCAFVLDQPINIIPTSFEPLEWDETNPIELSRGSGLLKLKFKALKPISPDMWTMTLYSDDKENNLEYWTISNTVKLPQTSQGETLEVEFQIWIDSWQALYIFPQIVHL